MKVFAILALVLAALVPAHADTTQTWVVTATCNAALGVSCSMPGDINAVFTTQLETGTFIDSEEGCFCPITATEPVVTGISGAFDDDTMSLVSSPGNDWLQDGIPEEVLFTAGGEEYSLHYDNGVRLNIGDANFEFLQWSALESVPEPAIFWMLFTAVLLLGLSRWAQLSLQKLSGR